MKKCFLLSAAILFVAFTSCAVKPIRPPLSSQSLLEALRSGGKVIYMRHTATTEALDKPGPGEWWKDCGEGRRLLSEKGRTDAAFVGESIRRLAVPISEVRCSEYCRAVETSTLLGLGAPHTDSRLNHWQVWLSLDSKKGLKRLAEGTKELLVSRPERGNVLLVSHKQDFRGSADPVLDNIQEGECVVFLPKGDGKFEIIGRIKLTDWAKMK